MSTNLNSTQNHSINPRQPMNRRTTASKQTATRSRQKENNLIAKWLIALASIVVTLGGWGLMASQDVSASPATPYIPYSTQRFLVNSAIAASAMAICNAVVACAQR